ncbi:MAG: hypothetical protein AAGA58_13830 [Verrucomicrobiota bacterium]
MKTTTLCFLLFTALSGPIAAGTYANAKGVIETTTAPEEGILKNPDITLSLGYDSQRFYRGFVIADDDWFFGQLDVIAWPLENLGLDIQYRQGVTDGGFEEQDVGVAGLVRLPKGFVFRAGWEWDNYGEGDLFIDNNHLAILALFHDSKFGRGVIRYVWDAEFEGDLFELGFQTHPYAITERLGVALQTAIRWNDEFFGVSDTGLSNVEVSLLAPYQITEWSRIVPFIRYSEPGEAIDLFTDAGWSGGVTVQFKF